MSARSFHSPAVSSDKGAIARISSNIAKALGVGGFVVAIATYDIAGLGVALMWLGSFVIMMSLALSFIRPEAEGAIELRDDGVVITRRGRERFIRKRDVVSAWVAKKRVASGDLCPVVEIRTRRGTTFSVRLANDDDAQAIVLALGFGVRGKAVRIDLARTGRRILHPMIGVSSYFVGGGGMTVVVGFLDHRLGNELSAALVLAGVCLMYALLKRVFAAPILTLGHDGIRLERRSTKTFIPRDQIRRLWMPGRNLPPVIELANGKGIGLGAVLLDDARVRAAIDLSAAQFDDHPPPERAAAFERSGRDARTWRADVRAKLDPGYRASAVSVDDANAVLASPHSTVEQKLGAAMTLRAAGEPPERVRIAAEGAADPRVRIAFEAIADDADDVKLEKALRRL